VSIHGWSWSGRRGGLILVRDEMVMLPRVGSPWGNARLRQVVADKDALSLGRRRCLRRSVSSCPIRTR
jgi:hypothetical protein